MNGAADSLAKIMVVDDEPSIIAYLSAILEDNGYAVCSTTDAADAAELARRERPDLICMDVMMPRRSGIALYRDIKRDPATCQVPVIFISAFGAAQGFSLEQMPKLIGDPRLPYPEAFLEKPIEIGGFLNVLSGALDRARQGAGRSREAAS
ncbi:MAG: Alkaline phosphatase synthesis transcriptional regulatory protein PhoP [candidate division BRC1 bacterium ADurb.BinA364]|nr:MAG: Alkaline phosphatase synthesis transcriptional regulatory protein PhoP [candidate division BRC1 bacterium ADurb.BinA364]